MINGQCGNPCPPGQSIGSTTGVCTVVGAICGPGTALVNGRCVNPCANGQSIGTDGKCRGATALTSKSSSKSSSKKSTTKQVYRCPDGSLVESASGCSAQPSGVGQAFQGLPFIFQFGGQGQQQQQETKVFNRSTTITPSTQTPDTRGPSYGAMSPSAAKPKDGCVTTKLADGTPKVSCTSSAP